MNSSKVWYFDGLKLELLNNSLGKSHESSIPGLFIIFYQSDPSHVIKIMFLSSAWVSKVSVNCVILDKKKPLDIELEIWRARDFAAAVLRGIVSRIELSLLYDLWFYPVKFIFGTIKHFPK